VYNEAGKPVEGALVEAEIINASFASLLDITGADGRYTLRLPTTAATDDSVRLSARSLNFAEQVYFLLNRSQRLDFRLRTQPTVLREVVVAPDPVRRQGDTLSYNVGSFADKKDRVIADVLRKIPGIEVDSDGRISYQGQSIEKFYINGLDLLEGRYNIASNNLPAGTVRDVQVLENHQPIKALDSLVFSTRTSLNLKLKKAVTLTGHARLGAGVNAGVSPALWNANLSPMLFTRKQQFIDSYQTNNTGEDVLAELKPLGLEDIRQLIDANNRKPELTSIQGLSKPPIASSRYLFNKANLFSANHLIMLGKETQLRMNSSYLHDAQDQRGSTQTQYYLPSQTLAVTEEKHNQLYFNNLQTDFAFIQNGKKRYLKNTLNFNSSWDTQTGNVGRSESPQLVIQQARNPFYAVTNRLGIVRPLGTNKMLQISSLTFYTNSPQMLAVSPGPFAGVLNDSVAYPVAQQHVRLTSFYTNNSAGIITSRGRWGYSGTIGITQGTQSLASALITDAAPLSIAADSLRNHLHSVWGKYYVQPAISYKRERWNVNLEVPVSFWNFKIADEPMATQQMLHTGVTEPNLSGRYNLNQLWYVTASSILSNQFGDNQQLNYAYLLRDYRTLQRNDAPIAQSLSWGSNAGFYYKNPLKALFYHISYSYLLTSSNRLYNNLVQSNGTITTVAVDQFNQQVSHSVATNISQFITPLKTTVSLSLSSRYAQQRQLLKSVLQDVRNQSTTCVFKINTSYFAWSNLEYNTTLTLLRNRIGDAADQSLTILQNHHAQLSVYPGEHHQLMLYADYYDSRAPGTTVRNLLADAVYRYVLPTIKYKADLEFKVSNLFGTNQYQYVYADQFILVQNTYRLRPRQLLASVRIAL
jgi:hypothetical protein